MDLRAADVRDEQPAAEVASIQYEDAALDSGDVPQVEAAAAGWDGPPALESSRQGEKFPEQGQESLGQGNGLEQASVPSGQPQSSEM